MHMFAIFLSTIIAILTAPLPSGAVMFIALAVAYFSGTLTFAQTLVGFSSGTVWLIFSAYILSLAFVKSGLGKRIAYVMLAKFGGSSLGIAYSLGIADFIMASAMPSVTARGGGIIMPVTRAICRVMGSNPGETGKKIGDYLMMTCFHFNPITGGCFMTGMAANLLAVQMAKWNFWHIVLNHCKPETVPPLPKRPLPRSLS
jgi:DASS family divalent anion:Na+ symporter